LHPFLFDSKITDYPEYLRDLYSLNEGNNLYLLQDTSDETNPQSKNAWIKRNHPELIDGSFGRKRRISGDEVSEGSKKKKTGASDVAENEQVLH